MTVMRGLLLAVLVLTALSTAAAAVCEAELRQLEAGLPDGMPEGSRAAQLLYGAVELLEPYLPAWHHNGTVPLEEHEAGHDAVAWLLGRDLLPDGWDRDELGGDAWRDMLGRFLGWYGLEGDSAAEADGSDPVADLARVLEEAAAAVRPVAVFAHEDGEVRFSGIIWNWSVYPRLLVTRLPPGTSVADGPAELLEQLGNCAFVPEHYALAPVDTAWRLFAGSGDADMYVLSSEPERPGWPALVSPDDVRDHLEFRADAVGGTLGFAAAFAGQELSVGAVLDMVTKLETNIPPLRITRYLAVPGE